MLFKLGVLKNFAIFAGEHLCWNLFLTNLQGLRPANLLKRNSKLVLSGEIREIFKNTYFYGTPPLAASGHYVNEYIVIQECV